jgi:hypothetical protein
VFLLLSKQYQAYCLHQHQLIFIPIGVLEVPKLNGADKEAALITPNVLWFLNILMVAAELQATAMSNLPSPSKSSTSKCETPTVPGKANVTAVAKSAATKLPAVAFDFLKCLIQEKHPK